MADVLTSDRGLSAISLYSGAGGMDVGFRNAGFDIILANDNDHDACVTYRMNHGDVIVEGDVRQLFPLMQHVKDIDLVFGGPPCQGFSVAGKMNPSDERNRLITAFFDAVDLVRPKAFVCENVKALAVLTRWRQVRDDLLARAGEDYFVSLIVLNSGEFGVPQSRERMFLIGLRKDVHKINNTELTEIILESVQTLKSQPPTIAEIVRKLGRAGTDRNKRICRAKITYAKSPVMRRSPYAGMLFNGAGRPLRPTGRSSTLPASMGGNKTPIVDEAELFDGDASFVELYHSHLTAGGKPYNGDAPARLRRLTIDECLAIQTIPAWYQVAGSQSAAYRQIGNAVPCKLAEVVAAVIKHIIENGATSVKDTSAARLFMEAAD